jgi:hypothetical protein
VASLQPYVLLLCVEGVAGVVVYVEVDGWWLGWPFTLRWTCGRRGCGGEREVMAVVVVVVVV